MIYSLISFDISSSKLKGSLEIKLTKGYNWSFSVNLLDNKAYLNFFNFKKIDYPIINIIRHIESIIIYLLSIIKDESLKKRPNRNDIKKAIKVILIKFYLSWKIEEVFLEGSFGFEEPDITAYVSSFYYQILPYFLNSNRVKLNIIPNFLESDFNFSGKVTLKTSFLRQFFFIIKIIANFSVIITIFGIFSIVIKEEIKRRRKDGQNGRINK